MGAARARPARRPGPRRRGSCSGWRCTRGRWSAARRPARSGASRARRSRRSSRSGRRRARPGLPRGKPPSARRAASRWPSSSRSRNWIGRRSIRSRHSRWTARTASGQAPNEPWFRNVTSGSRLQPRSVRIRQGSIRFAVRGHDRRLPGGPGRGAQPARLALARRPATARRSDAGTMTPVRSASPMNPRSGGTAAAVAGDEPGPRSRRRHAARRRSPGRPPGQASRHPASRSTPRAPWRRRWRPRGRRRGRGRAASRPTPPSPGRASG